MVSEKKLSFKHSIHEEEILQKGRKHKNETHDDIIAQLSQG